MMKSQKMDKMKFCCFLLLFVIVSSCSTSNKTSNEKVTFIINDKVIERNLFFKDGVAFVFSNDIYGELKLSPPKNPFSYGTKHSIKGKILHFPEDTIMISSFEIKKGKFNKHISNFVFGFAKKSKWNENSFNFLNTSFRLIAKKNTQIDSSHWKESIKNIWVRLNKKFGKYDSDQITFLELNWAPISGGPLGENVLGIFYQQNVPIKFQNDLKNDLNWEKYNSTKNYVERYYRDSRVPWNDYLIGTFAHELTHLYFGFGKSRQIVENAYELWFSLGLGMLYDIDITEELTGKKPAIFEDSFKVWKKFSKIKEIDQRLIAPNTKNDKAYKLDRKKVFAHSKAEFFLRELRKEIGHSVFNKAVLEYLNCQNCFNGYEDFKRFLKAQKHKITKIERKHKIY